MRYYLIAGEASGDLHASRLMAALAEKDPGAMFRYIGGDLMRGAAEGRGEQVGDYREMAYMGFIPVALHLRKILGRMRMCKADIMEWKPDAVVLVDYPGFNLDIAKYVRAHTSIPVFYYISPKIWAWKEYRIRNIKRDVDEMFSILPFEVDFYEKKHGYKIHYVGNPTADEVAEYKASHKRVGAEKPIIALLAGSRLQEIDDNLPAMIEAARDYLGDYRAVVAGAPSVEPSYYKRFLEGTGVEIVYDKTYELLSQATAAMVTSGTATLETALFGVPQVVCYRMRMARLMGLLRKMILKIRYVSLVNLIADREVVPELVAETFSVDSLRRHLADIMPGGKGREAMMEGYGEVERRLGKLHAPDNAAGIMTDILRRRQFK